MGVYKKSLAVVGAIALLHWWRGPIAKSPLQLQAERSECQTRINADLDLIHDYRMAHNYDFPDKFSELFTSKTLASPNDELAGCYIENGHWGRDYPDWGTMAAAIDSGELPDEFHYLGGELPNYVDLSTVVILCDTLPNEDGQDLVIVGLADGESRQVLGVRAAALKREFARGTRPLILLRK
jgi:hypothetical protein